MRITLLSAALLASGIANAAIPIDGWYTNVFGGYAFIPDNVETTTFGYFVHHASFNGGYNAGGRLGYKSDPLQYELEYTFVKAHLKGFRANFIEQRSVSGYTSANLAMANIYYNTPEMLPAITPYLGVGIGYAYVQDSLRSTEPFGLLHFTFDSSAVAYQGMIGLTYNFSENYAVNLGYRYVATSGLDNFGSKFQAHIANAGATYRFDCGNFK